jgi:hypothetical protein
VDASGSRADDRPPFRRFAAGEPALDDWAWSACRAVPIDQLADVVVARCSAVFQPDVVDAAFERSLLHSVSQNLGIFLGLLRGETDLSRIQVESPLSFARMQAELEVPQADLQRSYRVSFLTVWECFADAIGQQALAQRVDGDQHTRALRALASAVFTYQDFIVSRAAEKYTLVEGTLSQSRARMRQQLIRELVRPDGEAPPAADLAQLGYDLTLHHLAVLLPRTPVTEAESLLRTLRRNGLAADGLVYSRSMTSSAVWLGRVLPWTDESCAAVQSVAVDRGCDALLGDAHPGPDGLRTSYAQAQQVLDILGSVVFPAGDGARAPRAVRYSSVALDLLLMTDPAMAQAFVRRTLGELAVDSSEANRLCDTVETSLRLGSHVAAAESLGVHEQTVRNRLARAESLIGVRVRARRTEIEVALRIRRLLKNRVAAAPA